jgi:hypothetical protein
MMERQMADYLIANRLQTRTRHGKPCPVCGHVDWCLRTEDGSVALCARSDGVGSVKRYGEYGFLHILTPGLTDLTFPCPSSAPKRQQRADWELHDHWCPLVGKWINSGKPLLGALAEELGVCASSLSELSVGWDGEAWTFPERNGKGMIVGISRRLKGGVKRSARGGRRGLTYSHAWCECDGPILVVEGASDVAAGITLGLAVVGRPSNVGGKEMLADLLRDVFRKVVVVGERDKKDNGRWPGMEGCRTVAAYLGKTLRRTVSARLLPDNAKDLRSWLNGRVEHSLADSRKELLRWLAGRSR